MVRRLLWVVKLLLFTAVILLLGQIPSGGDTVGARFQKQVKKLWAVGGEELQKTKLVANLSQSAFFSKWVNNVYPPPKEEEIITEAPAETKEKESDEISSSDRESILRLLE